MVTNIEHSFVNNNQCFWRLIKYLTVTFFLCAVYLILSTADVAHEELFGEIDHQREASSTRNDKTTRVVEEEEEELEYEYEFKC